VIKAQDNRITFMLHSDDKLKDGDLKTQQENQTTPRIYESFDGDDKQSLFFDCFIPSRCIVQSAEVVEMTTDATVTQRRRKMLALLDKMILS
jgi:hypothetical protein